MCVLKIFFSVAISVRTLFFARHRVPFLQSCFFVYCSFSRRVARKKPSRAVTASSDVSNLNFTLKGLWLVKKNMRVRGVACQLKSNTENTYEVVDHGPVESADVEVEHPIDDGPLLWVPRVQPVVAAVFAHEIAHDGATKEKKD